MSEQLNTTEDDKFLEISENTKEAVVAKLGSVVLAHLIYGEDDEETLRFTLIRENNAGAKPGTISDGAELGKAVLDKAAGEETYFVTPDGTSVSVKILSVEPPIYSSR